MGKITELGDNFMKVEVADNVVVTVRKTAVEAVMPKGSLKEKFAPTAAVPGGRIHLSFDLKHA